MPRINRRIRRRDAGAAFEEKYGDILMFLITCGMHEPTAELARDVEAYCLADPRMRPQMERFLQDNEKEFKERAARRKAEAIG